MQCKIKADGLKFCGLFTFWEFFSHSSFRQFSFTALSLSTFCFPDWCQDWHHNRLLYKKESASKYHLTSCKAAIFAWVQLVNASTDTRVNDCQGCNLARIIRCTSCVRDLVKVCHELESNAIKHYRLFSRRQQSKNNAV